MDGKRRVEAPRGNRAFFSYARADAKIASWLYRALDSYRTPRALAGAEGAFGPVPTKLHPIFRDREDLAGGGALPERLQAALEDSEALIVLCTPVSAARHWVNEEILAFQRLGRSDRIFPVIADSGRRPEPDRPTADYLPPALRDLDLLAADLREIRRPNGQIVGDGREGGKLKLIAGLLGLKFDALARRERARQRALVAGLAAAVVAFAGLAAAAGWFGWQAEQQRAQAYKALARVFVERSWQAIERGDLPLAARYALAGSRIAPAATGESRAALGRVLHEAYDSRVLQAHEAAVSSARFSPDGTRIVTASWDGTARIWDAASGRELVLLRGHEPDTFIDAAFSANGSRVVTNGEDNTSRIWDATSGRAIAVFHDDLVDSAELGPNASRVATAAEDNLAVRIWDATSGRELLALRTQEQVSTVAFSPDGARAVTFVSSAGIARVWDILSGREIVVLRGHEASGWALFSPDGTRILTTSIDGTARLWSAGTGAPIAVLAGHDLRHSTKMRRAFSPDGTRVVTASSNIARIWDAASGRETCSIRGHSGAIESVAFSSDGKRIVTASFDGSARTWNAASCRELAVLRGHDDRLVSAAFNLDGTRIVTTSHDGTARIWSASASREIIAFRGPHNGDVAFSPDGKRVVTAADGARVWDIPSARETMALTEPTGTVRGVAFSPNGRRILTATDRVVRIWDAASGREVFAIDEPEEIFDVTFSPDGRRIASAVGGRLARIREAESGRILAVLRDDRDAVVVGPTPIESIAYSPDGKRVVTAGGDLRLWDAASGRVLANLERTEGGALRAVFSADGARIAAVSEETARVWDAASGRELAAFRGHEEQVTSAAFSPDGARVVTSSLDGTVRIWDATGARELAILRADEHEMLWRAVFSSDGRYVAAASEGGATRVWDVSRLTQPFDALARAACGWLLPPGSSSRFFSTLEAAADPLIREVWLRGYGEDRDVCEGTPGAPPRLSAGR